MAGPDPTRIKITWQEPAMMQVGKAGVSDSVVAEARRLLTKAETMSFPDYLDNSEGGISNFEQDILSQLKELHNQIEILFDREIELRMQGHS